MKAYFFFLLATFYCLNIQGQDNLLLQLSKAKNDTNKVNILDHIAQRWYFINPDSTLKYAKSGLRLADSLRFAKGIFLHKLNLAHASWEAGDYPSAIKMAYSLADEKVKYAYFEYVIFNSYRDMGEPREALKWIDTLKNNTRITLASMAACYYGLEKYDSALIILMQSMKRPPQPNFQSWINLIFARTYEKLNKPDEAKAYYKNSIEQLRKDNNYKDLSGALTSYAYFQLNNYALDSAIYFANQSYSISQQGKYQKEEYDAALVLANAYEKKHDTQEALKYFKSAIETKEKIYGKEKQKQIEGFKFTEELRKKEELTRQEQQKGQLRIYALVATLLFFGLTTILLILNNRQKQKSKRKIEVAYERLKNTQSQLIQSEKMASLGELTAGIAHEIQNPLNFVNNFSEVNTELIDELKKELAVGNRQLAEEIADDVKANSEKINHHGKRAGEIVKGMLQHSRTSSGQKELTDINILADEYLRLAYHGLRAKDKSFHAKFETYLDPALPKVNVVPQDIGRVILNLINNAFYAVNQRANNEQLTTNNLYDPKVIVSTKRLETKIEIRIQDNGPGIPDSIKEKIFQPFFTTKPTGQGTGLGLSLSYDIVKAHGGTIEVDSTVGSGTIFSISIPHQ